MSNEILSSSRLRELLAVFKKEHGEEYRLGRLGYFGSYARDEATWDSDVDIVFETDRPNLFRTVALKQDLEALLDRPVDVVRLRETMNPGLKARIEKDAIYV